jgi:head-tail adaptor
MAKVPTTSDLRHRVKLCSAQDVITEDGELKFSREEVFTTWAQIEAKIASQFNRSGENLLNEKERQTHLITIRFRRDIDVSSTAWIYEERAQSGARWFKVKGVRDLNEDGQFLQISASLLERGIVTPPTDEGATEVRAVVALHDHGVRL